MYRDAFLQSHNLRLNLALKVQYEFLLLYKPSLQILYAFVYNVLDFHINVLLQRIHNIQRKIHLQFKQFLVVVPVCAWLLEAVVDYFTLIIIIILSYVRFIEFILQMIEVVALCKIHAVEN